MMLIIIGSSFLFILALFLIVLFYYPGKPCPCCGHHLPKFRPSQGERERIYGGWTCPKCNCEIDTLGNIIKRAEEKVADRLNDDQREQTISQIIEKFSSFSTNELVEIFDQNNRRDWTDESLEAIRRLLISRGEKTPEQ
ncbi:MAG: hypothetical protein FD147_958 [Chloroflexi bacterium]|nr:MAG: hypothetical protein FD147_958 [Chloroflexota bacterium]MBA4376041.1 hypothetical protein [Anaerolinea sp.]